MVGCTKTEDKYECLDRMLWNEIQKIDYYMWQQDTSGSPAYTDSIKMSEYCIRHIEKELYYYPNKK
jgi:hypothetical protein